MRTIQRGQEEEEEEGAGRGKTQNKKTVYEEREVICTPRVQPPLSHNTHPTYPHTWRTPKHRQPTATTGTFYLSATWARGRAALGAPFQHGGGTSACWTTAPTPRLANTEDTVV